MLKVASVQFDPKGYDIWKNWERAKGFLLSLKGKGVGFVVLPELWWSEGRFREVIGDAVLRVDDVLRDASLVSKEIGANVVLGTLPETAGDKFYNTSFVIDRNGHRIGFYRKIHVFRYLGEDKYFKGGDSVALFDIDGVEVGLEICYDIRFFELARTLALRGAKVLLVPAAWPVDRLSHWRVLNIATAILAQVFVVSANRVGDAGALRYPGHSMIIDPWGEILAEGGDEPSIVVAEIDVGKVAEVRSRITVYQDMRPELYRM